MEKETETPEQILESKLIDRIEKRLDQELNKFRSEKDKEISTLQSQNNREMKWLNSIRDVRWYALIMLLTFFCTLSGLFIAIGIPKFVIPQYIEKRLVETGLKDTLEKIVKEKQETFEKTTKTILDFIITYNKAQSDDSEAFEQLATWGHTPKFKSYPYREISADMYEIIRNNYIEKGTSVIPSLLWIKETPPEEFSISFYISAFMMLPSRFHASLVFLGCSNKKVEEKQRIQLLIDVISGSKLTNSLRAKFMAGNLLSIILETPWVPFNYQHLSPSNELENLLAVQKILSPYKFFY